MCVCVYICIIANYRIAMVAGSSKGSQIILNYGALNVYTEF